MEKVLGVLNLFRRALDSNDSIIATWCWLVDCDSGTRLVTDLLNLGSLRSDHCTGQLIRNRHLVCLDAWQGRVSTSLAIMNAAAADVAVADVAVAVVAQPEIEYKLTN